MGSSPPPPLDHPGAVLVPYWHSAPISRGLYLWGIYVCIHRECPLCCHHPHGWRVCEGILCNQMAWLQGAVGYTKGSLEWPSQTWISPKKKQNNWAEEKWTCLHEDQWDTCAVVNATDSRTANSGNLYPPLPRVYIWLPSQNPMVFYFFFIFFILFLG